MPSPGREQQGHMQLPAQLAPFAKYILSGLSYAVFFVLGLWIGCALGIVLMILAQKWRREG
jgi:type IV secretory pathway TrbD component